VAQRSEKSGRARVGSGDLLAAFFITGWRCRSHTQKLKHHRNCQPTSRWPPLRRGASLRLHHAQSGDRGHRRITSKLGRHQAGTDCEREILLIEEIQVTQRIWENRFRTRSLPELFEESHLVILIPTGEPVEDRMFRQSECCVLDLPFAYSGRISFWNCSTAGKVI
jgi:hypothetical protein